LVPACILRQDECGPTFSQAKELRLIA
jgi:hypothetical protein